MLYISHSAQELREVKIAVRNLIPDVNSAHLSEALAAAAGSDSNAAFLVRIKDNSTPELIAFDDDRFTRRLEQLGYAPLGDWPGFSSIMQLLWVGQQFKGLRAHAWRNMMVSGVNSGLDQGIFTLAENGNHWPNIMRNEHKVGDAGYTFPVMAPNQIPALGYVNDAGFGELSIHVVYWPKSENILRAVNANFLAGDAFATGWLERKKGKWIQSNRRGKQVGFNLSIRNAKLPYVANAVFKANGYADHGDWFF